MRVAIVTPEVQNPDHLFGAERHFVGVVHAFQQKTDAHWIQVPASEQTWNDILRGYLDCFQLDLGRYDLVVSTKNPTYAVQHRNHVCWLLHQARVFYDRFDDECTGLPGYAIAEKGSSAIPFVGSTLSRFKAYERSLPMASKPRRG